MGIHQALKYKGYSDLEIVSAMMASAFSDPNVKAELRRQEQQAAANLMHSAGVVGASALLRSKFGHALSRTPKTEQVAFLLNEVPAQGEEEVPGQHEENREIGLSRGRVRYLKRTRMISKFYLAFLGRNPKCAWFTSFVQ